MGQLRGRTAAVKDLWFQVQRGDIRLAPSQGVGHISISAGQHEIAPETAVMHHRMDFISSGQLREHGPITPRATRTDKESDRVSA